MLVLRIFMNKKVEVARIQETHNRNIDMIIQNGYGVYFRGVKKPC